MSFRARQIHRSLKRFLLEEDGLESVEWLTLAILMASILIYIGRDLLGQIYDLFFSAIDGASPL